MAAVNRVERYHFGRIEEKTGCFKPKERELYGLTDVKGQTSTARERNPLTPRPSRATRDKAYAAGGRAAGHGTPPSDHPPRRTMVVEIDGLTKRYGDVTAVRDLSLSEIGRAHV